MRIGLLLQEKNVALRKIYGFNEQEAPERGGEPMRNIENHLHTILLRSASVV